MSSADGVTASECAASKFYFAEVRNHFTLTPSEQSDSLLESMRDHNRPHINDNEIRDSGYMLKLFLNPKQFVDMLHTIEATAAAQPAQDDSHTSDPLDMYSLKEAKLGILHHILKLSRPDRSIERRKEVEFRPVVDDLITLAFCQRRNSKHLYECEAELFLPAEPFTATADIATFLPLSTLWRIALTEEHACNQHVFCALTYETHLLTFAVEASIYGTKAKPGRQLTFYLCSAQNQRRALGFTDHIIYGLSLTGHMAQLFTSRWVGNYVITAPTRHRFNLSSFAKNMDLYIVLCKLAEHAEKQLEEMERSRNDPSSGIKEKNKEAVDKPWRRKDKPSGTHHMGTGTRAMDGEVEVSDDMLSDPERDSDSEEGFFEHSNITSKSFMTSPLKTESLKELTLETTTLTPAKDIGVWAQQIADEAEC